MKEFNDILVIIDRLLGPGGCPWDREQTLKSLRSSLLEETYETIEAIDLGDNHHIQEEFGDLFFNAVFLCKIGEKEQRLKLVDVLHDLAQKLIRRHPHVFKNSEIKNIDELWVQWDSIKQKEVGKTDRKSILDGIPKKLPSLSKAQKSMKKMEKSGSKYDSKFALSNIDFNDEEELGDLLIEIAKRSNEKGLDAEHALRSSLTHIEKEFRISEKKNKKKSANA